ncbi:MAG: KH domain-containing protein [Nanoarchaeota archaeon]|nr:KH domain-containing protein [Nanoarchaeota archaeon]
MIEEILVPEERLAVIIGNKGQTKKRIEEKTKTRLSVSSGIIVSGDTEGVLVASEIVRAISRGFTPREAFSLLNDDTQLQTISLWKETEATRQRLFARVIGRSGKVRQNIERYTRTTICVYGKTVSVIGRFDTMRIAVEAIKMILNGRSIVVVYNFIEKQMREQNPLLPDE